MQVDEIRQALWAMISETNTHRELALAVKRHLGWKLSDHGAQVRLAQWLSPSDKHWFPASLIPLAIRVTGRDYVSPILTREALRAQLEREERMKREEQERARR